MPSALLSTIQMHLLSVIASALFRFATEDRVAIHTLEDTTIVALADGAGGMPGGAAAADGFMRTVAEEVAAGRGTLRRGDSIVGLLQRVDRELERLPLVGETTAILVVIGPEGITGASCGDSSALVVGREDCDDLTAAQKRKLRLGCGRAIPVGFKRGALDGTLVVGSDGLFNFAKEDVICANARGPSLSAAACALVASVRTASGDLNDDVAVALVRSIGEEPTRARSR